MSDPRCGTVRESIPDFVGGRLSADEVQGLEEHLVPCAECRSELELAQVLLASRTDAPEGLAQRIMVAVRDDQRGSRRPWWGMSAAAVAALALGIGVMSEPGTTAVEVPGFAYEMDEGALWVSDDGLLAGAPTLDLLTDEALAQLLEEMTAGSAGGAV